MMIPDLLLRVPTRLGPQVGARWKTHFRAVISSFPSSISKPPCELAATARYQGIAHSPMTLRSLSTLVNPRPVRSTLTGREGSHRFYIRKKGVLINFLENLLGVDLFLT